MSNRMLRREFNSENGYCDVHVGIHRYVGSWNRESGCQNWRSAEAGVERDDPAGHTQGQTPEPPCCACDGDDLCVKHYNEAAQSCSHPSQSGDEGPVALLGRSPHRWRCDVCEEILYDPELLSPEQFWNSYTQVRVYSPDSQVLVYWLKFAESYAKYVAGERPTGREDK